MKQLFINLPVSDMKRSREFYLQLGFVENPVFSGENQTCMAWGEGVLVMLQSMEFFAYGSKRPVADEQGAISASFTLPLASPKQVAEVLSKAVAAGGRVAGESIDEGYMQVHTLADPDGHIWGIMYLDRKRYLEVSGKG
jgi:predicted lactoylglutathione lyase